MIRKIGPKLLDALLAQIAAAAVSAALSRATKIARRYVERRNNLLNSDNDPGTDELREATASKRDRRWDSYTPAGHSPPVDIE
jgi:hypothetical protein